MSLAHKSLEGELRRPARLFISRTGSQAQGGSAPVTGSCCAICPAPEASRCCCCSGAKASERFLLLILLVLNVLLFLKVFFFLDY